MNFRYITMVTLTIAMVAGCLQQDQQAKDVDKTVKESGNAAPVPAPELPRVAFEIEQSGKPWGKIIYELDAPLAPITTKNFLDYVDAGYYDGTLIHRVVVGVTARIQVFQGGGYTTLGGLSKPGQHVAIKNESDNGLHNTRGTIAMARDAAPDTATSEYFVNLQANPSLDFTGKGHVGYCVFGRVVDGMEVVDRISRVETVTNPDPELRGEKSQPIDPPVVKRAYRIFGEGSPE